MYIRSAMPAPSGSVRHYRPSLAAPEAGPEYTPFHDLADAVCPYVIIDRQESPHSSQQNEVITVHRLERTTANPLYLPEKLISWPMHQNLYQVPARVSNHGWYRPTNPDAYCDLTD